MSPQPQSSAPVAVTGATGFVASHLVKQLLERGFKVHGTVRSLSNTAKYQFLLDLPNAQENLKLFEADLEKEGSFDEVVQGCEIVHHTASPFFLRPTDDPQKELVNPAVNGTLTVLKSAQKAKSVRRVVITSSIVAIYDPLEIKRGKIFTEQDWNKASSLTHNPYWFSKVKAETAAWEFLRTEKPQFDLVTINPPFIVGEVLTQVKNEQDLNTSNAFLKNVLQAARNGEAIGTEGYGYVDVHDVAEAHILTGLALDNEKVSNQRFLVIEGSYTLPEVIRTAVSLYPQDFKNVDPNNLKLNGDEKEGSETRTVRASAAHLQKALPEFKYIPFATTLKNTVDNLRELNFW